MKEHRCLGPLVNKARSGAATGSGSLKTAGVLVAGAMPFVQLVVWPEVSQYWCQQSSVRVWVSDLIS